MQNGEETVVFFFKVIVSNEQTSGAFLSLAVAEKFLVTVSRSS